jgi:hypothetical protein
MQLHKSFRKLLTSDQVWILSPNYGASESKQHGAFDDDQATVKSALARILNIDSHQVELNFRRSASSLRSRREHLL